MITDWRRRKRRFYDQAAQKMWFPCLLLAVIASNAALANPTSKPYIAFRTSPFDQDVDHAIDWDHDATNAYRSHVHTLDEVDSMECPLQFSLGISRKVHGNGHHASAANAGAAIRQPPLIRAIFPGRAGQQVLYVTQYEQLDLLTPAPLETPGDTIKEALIQDAGFPVLLESSSFHAAPIVHDVNGDGRVEAIVCDYDGGIYMLGLGASNDFFHKAQVPRMYVRREWVAALVNQTLGRTVQVEDAVVEDPDEVEDAVQDGQDGKTKKKKKRPAGPPPHEPFHTYFEYYYSSDKVGEEVLRNVPASVIAQSDRDANAIAQRRGRRVHNFQKPSHDSKSGNAAAAVGTDDALDVSGSGDASSQDRVTSTHRRLQEVDVGQAAELRLARGAKDFVAHPALDTANEKNETVIMDVDVETEKIAYDTKDIDAAVAAAEQQKDSERVVLDTEQVDAAAAAEEAKLKAANEHVVFDTEDIDAAAARQDTPNEGKDEKVVFDTEEIDAAAAAAAVANEHDVLDTDSAAAAAAAQADRDLGDYSGESAKDLPAVDDPAGYVDDVPPLGGGEVGEGRVAPHDDEYPAADDYADNTRDKKVGDLDDLGADDFGRNPEHAYDDHMRRYGDYDDMYGRGYDPAHEEYYDQKHYIRVTPHILCQPAIAEVPRLYGDTNEMDDILFVAVSYFLDEDEYDGLFSYERFEKTDAGDETEVRRGTFVASALMAYVMGDSTRWSGQNHLDLSTDFSAPENVTVVGDIPIREDVSRMGAFALSTPVVADLDGDGTLEVLVATSMGMIYGYDARQLFKKSRWPVQLKGPIEHRLVVEDVRDDTNLEVFAADIFGNIVCLAHDASRIWDRNLVSSLGDTRAPVASSPLALGDVDGNGKLDVVQAIQVSGHYFLFALDAATGEDLPHFPIELEVDQTFQATADQLHDKLPQPLLVDLHGGPGTKQFLEEYLRRNGTSWQPPSVSRNRPAPHGGRGAGLHIVQPIGSNLFTVEASTGCHQTTPIGDSIASMVQVDDVHGNDRLDLVVTTETGKLVTLEAAAPDFHPLNAWNNGELRGRSNAYAHGYSASQGIFVHKQSREINNVFGVYVPITFEIFDNRPNIAREPDRRKYVVEIRDGPSSKRATWRREYTAPGVYTERVYIRFGPGYYSLSILMKSTHGIVYEDTIKIGYNINFLDGFGMLLWLPLFLAAAAIFLCGSRKSNWQEDDDYDNAREGASGILGRALPM